MTDHKQAKYNNPFIATITGIGDLFRHHEAVGTLHETDRLDGKTVLVDGASSGLGYAIATDCARRGARIIMACRSGIHGRGEAVKKTSGNPDVHMLPVDFSYVESIKQLAISISEQFAPIDIYICNAGIVPRKSRKTRQGLEEMFMVNYLSKFLFVNLLLKENCFRSSSSHTSDPAPLNKSIPRIIFVSSESHRNPGKIEWDKFGIYEPYSIGKSMELYGYYKLFLTAFSLELSQRLNPDGLTRFSVFTLCPGPINSNIGREAPKIFHPLMKLIFGIFFKSPAKAAVPVIYLAASKDLEGKPFDYLFLMSRKEIAELSADPLNRERLWELSWQLSNKLGVLF